MLSTQLGPTTINAKVELDYWHVSCMFTTSTGDEGHSDWVVRWALTDAESLESLRAYFADNLGKLKVLPNDLVITSLTKLG